MRASLVLATAGMLMFMAGVTVGGDGNNPATFVEKAAQDGMTEVALGKIAQRQGQSADVQAFGAHMVKDHGKANAELKSIAQAKGLTVPTKLDTEHQAMVDKMSALSGAQFDAEYARNMTVDHTKAIALFTEASKGNDADLASFAKKTLPTLEEHKAMADKLAASTGSATAAGA